jgi:hypothetical protein
MATITNLKIKTPLGDYSTDKKEYEAIADMKVTYERSGKEIREVANIQDVPWTLALAVAVVENAGLTGRSQDGLSYGAMQTNAATLDGVIKFAFKDDYPFNKFFYIYYRCSSAFTLKAGVKIPKQADLFKPEHLKFRQKSIKDLMTYKGGERGGIFSGKDYTLPTNRYNQLMITDKIFGLHVGFIFLMQLISQSIVAEGSINRIRMDWVINGYNGGYYKKGNPWETTTPIPVVINGKQENRKIIDIPTEAYLTLPTLYVAPVTKKYVKRICGKGGYLELLKLKKIVF